MSILDSLTGKDKEMDSHAAVSMPERVRKPEKVIILTTDNTEDTEFFYPYYRLSEEGYAVDVATPKGGEFKGKHGLGLMHTIAIGEVSPQEYSLLYIPGGKAPAELRENEEVLAFVKNFAARGKPIGAICHGPQVLLSAGLLEGKQVAAWPEIKDEVEKAGARFIDEPLVEDGQFITAGKPGDLPYHLYGVLKALKGGMTLQGRSERAPAVEPVGSAMPSVA